MSGKVVVSASRMACWGVGSALALAVAVFAAAPSVAQPGSTDRGGRTAGTGAAAWVTGGWVGSRA